MANFSEEESAKLENLTEYYFKLKDLMLYSEVLGDQEIFLPPVNEISQSYDRIMRIMLTKFDPIEVEINTLLELDKATSSIYNAIVQSLDYISIYQLEYIQNLGLEEELDYEAIEKICPGTHALFPEILMFQKNVQDLKSKGNPITKDEVSSFMQEMSPIKSHIEKIKISKKAIIELSMKMKADKDRKSWSNIIAAIIGGVIGAIIGAASTILFQKLFT